MELRTYLTVLARRWPIAVLAFVVTTGVTVALIAREPSRYESTATFVIRPRAIETDDGLRALDTLVRGVEINATYARIARSDPILERARARLEDGDARGLQVTADVVTGTNILEIVVTGPDPQGVHDMAAAVGGETVAYIAELQDVFELAPLEAPEVPRGPVGPNKPLLIGIGALFGTGLAGLLALLTEGLLRLVRPARWQEHAGLDVTGHLEPRGAFHQELDTALRSNRPFSAAVLRVAVAQGAGPPDAVARARTLFRLGQSGPNGAAAANGALDRLERLALERIPRLGEDHVAAYLGDGTFAVLLPGASAQAAQDLVRNWRLAVAVAAARDSRVRRARITTGVFHYGGSENGDRVSAGAGLGFG